MGKNVDQIAEIIKEIFPKLKTDTEFKVTSKEDERYNCIAWAYNINNRWMWPNTGDCPFIDGVHYWPSNEIMEPTVENFIKAFRLKGYEVCDNFRHEEGYQKVALYAIPGTNICTHASRELANGKWTSKLGQIQDIQHGDPTTIENDGYGKVCCIMKRVFK